MNWTKWLWIVIVALIGLIFLVYFWVTIKTLDSPTNARLVNINGTIYLEWDPPKNGNLIPEFLNYVVGLSVDGFLSKQTTRDTKVPIYIGTEPVKSNQHGIMIQFVIVAQGGLFNPSSALNGTLVT